MAALLLRAARARGATILLSAASTRTIPAASFGGAARCFASDSAASATETAKKGGSVRLWHWQRHSLSCWQISDTNLVTRWSWERLLDALASTGQQRLPQAASCIFRRHWLGDPISA